MTDPHPRTLPDEIAVVAGLRPSSFSLLIDGVEFPWYVGEDITVTVARHQQPGINVFIPATRVRVDHDVNAPRADA